MKYNLELVMDDMEGSHYKTYTIEVNSEKELQQEISKSMEHFSNEPTMCNSPRSINTHKCIQL